jgi:hypothetical protein
MAGRLGVALEAHQHGADEQSGSGDGACREGNAA